ncbi:hypothetical protein EDB48_104160 [Vibrio crassostreae]|nr:hypothetical protein EDB48_104160 [Vibrio crassostreae]
MREIFSKWWEGEQYHIKDVYPGTRYRRHWTSALIHLLLEFYLQHWKWVIGTFITILGVIISLLVG